MIDGKLNVKSTLEKGSTFSLDLDLPEVSPHANITNVEENNIVGFKGAQQKVLVVDDEWANRSVFVNLLKPMALNIFEVIDGLDALSKVGESKPDLIFLGLVMPVMDSFEATHRARMLSDFTDVMIIAISAGIFNFDKQLAKSLKEK